MRRSCSRPNAPGQRIYCSAPSAIARAPCATFSRSQRRPARPACTWSCAPEVVIARIWRGAVRNEDADEYVTYIRDTGIEHYRSTPGNLGAWILHRRSGDRTEIITFSLWEDMESVKSFAGDEPSVAVYYLDDDRFLVERADTVEHYDVD